MQDSIATIATKDPKLAFDIYPIAKKIIVVSERSKLHQGAIALLGKIEIDKSVPYFINLVKDPDIID